ncbi:MAG TPA: hypothetical protein VF607_15730 [Verrucomicrobiae bacterium]
MSCIRPLRLLAFGLLLWAGSTGCVIERATPDKTSSDYRAWQSSGLAHLDSAPGGQNAATADWRDALLAYTGLAMEIASGCF